MKPIAISSACVALMISGSLGLRAPAAEIGRDISLTFHSRLPAPLQAQVQRGDLKTLWPVTFGIPFPQGALTTNAALSLQSASGAELPIQVRTTARWGDGSIQWVLIDSLAPLPATSAVYRVKWGQGIEPKVYPPPAAPLATGAESPARATVQQDDSSVVLDTGVLQARFSKKHTGLFQAVSLSDGKGGWRPMFPPEAQSDIYLEDGAGKAFCGSLSEPPEVVVEESGPLRVAVKIEGWTQAKDGQKLGRHIIRVQAFAGQRWLRLYHTFINTADSEEVQFRNIALHLPFQGKQYQFLGINQKEARAAGDSDYLLQYRHNEFEVVAKEAETQKGTKAPGGITVSSGDTAYTVSTRFFWQMFPREVEVTPGQVNLHFWPRHGKPAEHLGTNMTVKNIGHLWWAHEGQKLDFHIPKEFYQFIKTQDTKQEDNVRDARYANAFGIARTCEYWFDFHGGQGKSAPPAESVAEVFMAYPMMVVDPQWLADSQAFGNIAPRNDAYREAEEISERSILMFSAMMDRIGDYGVWNFGSYHQGYLPTLDAAALNRIWPGFHHGGSRWPWIVFARSGDPRFYDFAEAHARQLMDVCTCNWEDPAYNKKHWNDEPRVSEWWAYNCSLKYLGGLCRYKGFVHWYGGQRMFYNADADYALWYYYLTGYQRAWDMALAHGRFLLRAREKIDDPKSNDIYEERTGMARGNMAITLYQATRDERYLDLARRQMERYMQLADAQTNSAAVEHIYNAPFVERYWEITRDPKVKEYALRWAKAKLNQKTLWDERDVWYNLMALGYQFTGDEAFLKYGLAQLRPILDTRMTGVDPVLEGVSMRFFAGTPGYIGQQWGYFQKALNDHYLKTNKRLPIPSFSDMMDLRYELAAPRFAFHVRKEAGEEVLIPFKISSGQVTVTGPDGQIRLKDELKGKSGFDLKLMGKDAPGDYSVEFVAPGKNARLGLNWPLPGQYRKIVLEAPFWIRKQGGLYFLPGKPNDGRPAQIKVECDIRENVFQTHRVYRPDGTLHAAKSWQGLVTPRDFSFAIDSKDRGNPWYYSLGGLRQTENAMLSGDIDVVAFVRDQFFVPERFK